MSYCCNTAQNTISNSVNINEEPGSSQNSCTVRVNIPINPFKKLYITGEVVNSCTGLSIPYANLQLFEKSNCGCQYKLIAYTTSNCRGMYEFNLFLNRNSGCKKYKIVASMPCQTTQPVMPISSTPYVSGGCSQTRNSCCCNNPEDSCAYTSQNNCCEYTVEYLGSETSSFNQNRVYNNCSTCNTTNTDGCCNTGYSNVQELQDGYPTQNFGYIQNVCNTQPQSGTCSNNQCCGSNFWND